MNESCLRKSYLPKSMIDNVLVPVIKSKTGRIMSKDNYRPIALVSVVRH